MALPIVALAGQAHACDVVLEQCHREGVVGKLVAHLFEGGNRYDPLGQVIRLGSGDGGDGDFTATAIDWVLAQAVKVSPKASPISSSPVLERKVGSFPRILSFRILGLQFR